MIFNKRLFVLPIFFVLTFCQHLYGEEATNAEQNSSERVISVQSSSIDSPAVIGDPYYDEFLEVQQAFRLQPRLESGDLLLHWVIADGYYLYKNQLKLQLEVESVMSDAELTLPSGKAKYDQFFGDVEVYYQQLSARASLLNEQAIKLSVRSQGCADAGLCYPPSTQHFQFNTASSEFDEVPGGFTNAVGRESSSTSNPGQSPSKLTSIESEDTSLLLMMLFAFLGGTILNLMPCVFPILALKILGLVNASTISVL